MTSGTPLYLKVRLRPRPPLAAGHKTKRNRRFSARGDLPRIPRWSIKPQGAPLTSPKHWGPRQSPPWVPNGASGEKRSNIFFLGERVGFVRRLREK